MDIIQRCIWKLLARQNILNYYRNIALSGSNIYVYFLQTLFIACCFMSDLIGTFTCLNKSFGFPGEVKKDDLLNQHIWSVSFLLLTMSDISFS